jgi:cell division protein FtsB
MSPVRKALLFVSLMASAGLVVHTFFASDGWKRRARAARDLAGIEAEIAADQKRAGSLRAQIDALRTRSQVQEHVVRDELGYVRPGDVIVDASSALR